MTTRTFVRQPPAARAQRGQAAVFVLLFLGILLISLNFLYKQGRVVSDKMELQNGADATAYSISVTEARDLNFAAYMNRAMVANEVAIGQLMGLASWGFLYESYADFLNAYVRPMQEIPLVNGIPAAVYGLTGAVFRAPSAVIIPLTKNLADIGTTILHYINKFYGFAQIGYHTVTALISIGTIDRMVNENAPPGARISGYGILQLITHFATYGSVPLPSPPIPAGAPQELKDEFEQYVEAYLPTSRVSRNDFDAGELGPLEGYQRFSSIVRDSRDPFTLDKTWTLSPFEIFRPEIDAVGDALPAIDMGFATLSLDVGVVDRNIGGRNFATFDISFDASIDLLLGGADFNINFYFGIGVTRKGGSELRMVIPANGAISAGEVFNWSSADTSSLEAVAGLSLGLEIWVNLFFDRVTIFSFNGSGSIGNNRIVVSAGFGGASGTECRDVEDPDTGDIEEVCEEAEADDGGLFSVSIPFPTSAPFGAAFSEAGITNRNDQKLLTMYNEEVPLVGPVPTDAYGNAAGELLAWDIVGTPVPGNPVGPGFTPNGVAISSDVAGLAKGDTRNRVNKKYRGLPPFIDSTGVDRTLFGFGAPYTTISLVLDEADHDAHRGGTGGNHPEMGSGQLAGTYSDLRLTENFANGQLHSVGRSEVYFRRPNDLDYFARLDGLEEYGSAFNPYWNARLTDTRWVDQATALLIQQGQDVTGVTAGIQQALAAAQGFIDSLGSLSFDDFLP